MCDISRANGRLSETVGRILLLARVCRSSWSTYSLHAVSGESDKPSKFYMTGHTFLPKTQSGK